MIALKELRPGNCVIVEYEGQLREGVVTEIDHSEKQVCIDTGVQNFWYTNEHLFPVILDDSVLKKLGFEKTEEPDGRIKYCKGAFRLQLLYTENFSSIEMWYREDYRFHPDVHYLHQLQNHYFQMTKVELEWSTDLDE